MDKDKEINSSRMPSQCMSRCNETCITANVAHVQCIRDKVGNPVWASLELLRMLRKGKPDLSEDIIGIVEGSMSDLAEWLAFLTSKSDLEHANNIYGEQAGEGIFNFDQLLRIAAIAEHRDIDLRSHTVRVGRLAGRVAAGMDLPPDFSRHIARAAVFHDIGVMMVPEVILKKNGKLTVEEYAIMKEHPLVGSRILSGDRSAFGQMAASIALCHHENWDGSGYPNALSSSQIPVAGAITKICDCYDALRSVQSYRGAYSHEDAIESIVRGDERGRPEHFMPEVLVAFVNASDDIDNIFNAESALNHL